MTATTYSDRHEAIRKLLQSREYRQVWYHDHKGQPSSELWHRANGDPSEVWIPVPSCDHYADEIERIEIRLGLRLSPEVQKHVDAERARILAIVTAHKARSEQIENDERRFRVDRIKAHYYIECCDEIAKAIEGGEMPP